MHKKSWFLSAAALLLVGCARAQEGDAGAEKKTVDPDFVRMTPEQIQQVPVVPSLLEKTAWRAGGGGRLRTPAGAEVRDYAGRTVWKSAAAVRDIPVQQAGYYTLHVNGKVEGFAVVPRFERGARADGKRFGLNTHFGQRGLPENAIELLQLMGVDAVRDEIGWAPLEKEKGVWTYNPRHDAYTRALKEAGIPLLWSASYGNKLYNEGRYPDNPAAAEGYGRYVVKVLERYGDNIIGVEILNEPNKVKPIVEYIPVLKAAHGAVRGAGFKHEIIGIGGAGIGGGMQPAYARTVLDNGGRGLMDSFSQHPYMTPAPPDTGYRSNDPGNRPNLDNALTRGTRVAQDFGLKGNWLTEIGWPGPRPDVPADEKNNDSRRLGAMVSAEKQAAFTVRTLLGATRYPALRGVFLYDFQDDGPDPMRREHRFGLVQQNLAPKPAFQAYSVASGWLRDKTFVRRVQADNSLLSANIYRDAAGRLHAAVWSTEVTLDEMAEDSRTKKLDARYMERRNEVPFTVTGAGAVAGIDWQGRALQPGDIQALVARGLPLYLTFTENDAQKLGIAAK